MIIVIFIVVIVIIIIIIIMMMMMMMINFDLFFAGLEVVSSLWEVISEVTSRFNSDCQVNIVSLY